MYTMHLHPLLVAFLSTALVVGRAQAGGGACTFPPFYADAELPVVHEVEMLMARSDFVRLVNNQADRNYPETPTTIIFNGMRLPNAKVQVHGGTPQRTGNNPKVGLSMIQSNHCNLNLVRSSVSS